MYLIQKSYLLRIGMGILAVLVVSCSSGKEIKKQSTESTPPNYEITTEVDPEYTGWIDVIPDKARYEKGEKVTIKARPGGRYHFDRWGGNLKSSSSNPIDDYTIEKNTHVVAHFEGGHLAEEPMLTPRSNVFYMDAPRDLHFVVHQNKHELEKVSAEGEELQIRQKSNEDSTSNQPLPDSRRVILQSEQIEELGSGSHRIAFEFADGTVLDSNIKVVPAAEKPEHDMNIVTFNVDHGDATLIKMPNGETVLIDVATRPAAEKYLVPFLKNHLPENKRGEQRIDHLIITHWHADHFGGLRALLPEFDVGEIYYNLAHPPNAFGEFDDHEQPNDPYNFGKYGFKPEHYEPFKVGNELETIGSDEVKIKVLNAAEYDENDPRFRFYRTEYFEQYDGRNNRSLSLRLEYKDFVYTHGGNIYQHAQRAILYSYPEQVPSHIYHANHHFHGGLEVPYLIMTNPQLFLVSASEAIYRSHAYVREVLQETVPVLKRQSGRFQENLLTREVGHSVLRIDGDRNWSNAQTRVPYETYFIRGDADQEIRIPYLFNSQ